MRARHRFAGVGLEEQRDGALEPGDSFIIAGFGKQGEADIPCRRGFLIRIPESGSGLSHMLEDMARVIEAGLLEEQSALPQFYFVLKRKSIRVFCGRCGLIQYLPGLRELIQLGQRAASKEQYMRAFFRPFGARGRSAALFDVVERLRAEPLSDQDVGFEQSESPSVFVRAGLFSTRETGFGLRQCQIVAFAGNQRAHGAIFGFK
jgi:hypothetical protein